MVLTLYLKNVRQSPFALYRFQPIHTISEFYKKIMLTKFCTKYNFVKLGSSHASQSDYKFSSGPDLFDFKSIESAQISSYVPQTEIFFPANIGFICEEELFVLLDETHIEFRLALIWNVRYFLWNQLQSRLKSFAFFIAFWSLLVTLFLYFLFAFFRMQTFLIRVFAAL